MSINPVAIDTLARENSNKICFLLAYSHVTGTSPQTCPGTNCSKKNWKFLENPLSLHLNMTTQVMTQQIAEYFKTQPVLKAWLFGSFARGEQTAESDLDLLVQFDHSTPIGLFAYARMRHELEEKLGREVDLVEEGTLRPAIETEARKDMKIIYERAN